jgi:hypothetical protein
VLTNNPAIATTIAMSIRLIAFMFSLVLRSGIGSLCYASGSTADQTRQENLETRDKRVHSFL